MNILGYFRFRKIEKLFKKHTPNETTLADFFFGLNLEAPNSVDEKILSVIDNLLYQLIALGMVRDVDATKYVLFSSDELRHGVEHCEFKTLKPKLPKSGKINTAVSLVIDGDVEDIDEVTEEDVKRYNRRVQKAFEYGGFKVEYDENDGLVRPSFIIIELFNGEKREISLIFRKK